MQIFDRVVLHQVIRKPFHLLDTFSKGEQAWRSRAAVGQCVAVHLVVKRAVV